MAALTDHQWGIKRETIYGTAVTVDRFYPWLPGGVKAEWDVRRRTAQGLAGGGGRRGPLSARSYLPTGIGTVTTKVELETRQAGVLFDLAFGASTVTAITGGSQQVYHPGLTSSYLPSATIQVAKIRNDGTPWVETYAGCTASKVTIEQPVDGIPTIEVEWDARSVTTGSSPATATYVYGTILDATYGAAGLGGTLTVPTTTALATGLTAFAEMKSFHLEIEQAIDRDRWVLGGRNQPIAGIPAVSFSGQAEFTSSTLPAAVLAGTQLAFQCTWTTPEVLGAGFAQAQLVIPKLALTGDLPTPDMGKTGLVDVKASAPNDGINRDVYWVWRTADTVL